MAKSKEKDITRNTTTKHQRRQQTAAERGKVLRMKAIDWLKRKLHVEEEELVIGKKYYEKCSREIGKELEESYSTYMIMKDKGYEPNDVLILLEHDGDKFTGKKITTQVYSVERDSEGIVGGYCVVMVENMGFDAWKVR